MELLFFGWIYVAVFLAIIWALAMLFSRPQLIDIGWSLSMCFLGGFLAFSQEAIGLRQWAIAIMAVIAFGKLALLLLDRLFRGEIDSRYTYLDKVWEKGRAWKYFLFFESQSFAAVFLAIPWFLTVEKGTGEFSFLELFALALFLLSFAGETSADWSLKKFKEEEANKGKVCQRGLWAYSRHPNYFFQVMMWVSFSLFAIEADYGYLGLVSPLIMGYLIIFVTGIPPNEERQLEKKEKAYRAYMETTSAFVPWFRFEK